MLLHARPALILLVAFCGLSTLLQGAQPRRQAAQPRRSTNQNPRIYKSTVEPHWIAGRARFWYRNDLAGGLREFILVDADTGTRVPAFDHARLASALSRLIGRKVRADSLPIDSLDFIPQTSRIRLLGRDQAWLLDSETFELTKLTSASSVASNQSTGQRHSDLLLPRLVVSFDESVSINGGDESGIEFENLLCHDIQLFWIDGEGQQRRYANVIPGARYSQHSFTGHVWMVATPGGDALGYYTAGPQIARAVAGEEILQHGRSGKRVGTRSESNRRAPRTPADNRDVVTSPDGTWDAFVRDHNLWLRDHSTGEEHPLSTNGTAGDTYHRDAVRDRAIGMNYTLADAPESLPEVIWSPDSTRLIALRTQIVPERRVYLIESSPAGQVQPLLHSYSYLKPGDPIPVRKPHLFTVADFREVPVSDALFPTPWEISDFRWSANSEQFTCLYNARGHQTVRLLRVDARTGNVQILVDEHSQTFIHYSAKLFVDYLHETQELIWASERDGWNHLYLYDTQGSDHSSRQITTGNWVVRGVEHIDREQRQIWFKAGGIRPGQDPYYVHYCRVNFDGTGLVVLTEGDGTHDVRWSPDRKYLIDTYSRVDLPPVTELRRGDDGTKVCLLEEADAREVQETGRPLPEPFVAKGRDGSTDIYGVIHRPQNFEAGKKYPVIESIYAGPHSAHVPKSFRAAFNVQNLADEGFLVVQIDGMGTSHRSKKFHDVCWKNLADAGLPDRIAWLKAAASQHPEFDLTRVGIYGGSAGGQNALGALLTQGDFYKAAVADCGCHDNRMDKIWWNEQWMGYPLGPHYAEQSNVTQAHRLQGKLMLVVGELDRNVDPASTMQVANALIKADKDFDLLVIPGSGHGALGSPYATRRMHDFFKRHLLENSK